MLHSLDEKDTDKDKPKRKVNPNSLKNLKHVKDKISMD